jgi:hydroxyacylglutathione hydrolase
MMIIRQFKSGGDNFSYLIADPVTKKALVIDPFYDMAPILEAAQSLGSKIEWILNTHGHSDHTSGNIRLKEKTGARVMMHSADAGNRPDIDMVVEDEYVLELGRLKLQIIHTPGHTPGGICLYAENNLFTGDTLFVGDSGRTDLPGGDRPALGASIRKLMKLNEQTVVWPGHDYGPMPHSTLAWEKRHNVNAREYGYYSEE